MIGATFTKLIIRALKDLVLEKCTGIHDTIKRTLARWLRGAVEIVGKLFSKISEILKDVADMVIRLFCKLMGVSDSDYKTRECASGTSAFLKRSIGLMIGIALVASGVISLKYLSDLAQLTGLPKHDLNDLVTVERETDEGRIELGKKALLLIAEGFTHDQHVADQIALKVRTMTFLVAGLTTTGVVLKMIFSILPIALQDWFLANYAPAFLRAKAETSDWCAEALGMLQSGTIPYVFTSDEYSTGIKKMLSGASRIIMDASILDATSRPRFNYLHAKLTQLSMNLAQFHGMGSSRTRPFAVHIAGEPGCGKSIFVPNLLKDCFGLVDSYSFIWSCRFISRQICHHTTTGSQTKYSVFPPQAAYNPVMEFIGNTESFVIFLNEVFPNRSSSSKVLVIIECLRTISMTLDTAYSNFIPRLN